MRRRRLIFVTAIVLGGLCVPSLATSHVMAPVPTRNTGFVQPYAGTPKYLQYAPTEATSARQINRPIGAKAADRIARKLGLDKAHAFTAKQYALFISGNLGKRKLHRGRRGGPQKDSTQHGEDCRILRAHGTSTKHPACANSLMMSRGTPAGERLSDANYMPRRKTMFCDQRIG